MDASAGRKMQALADFDGPAYGPEYMKLSMDDVVVIIPHEQAGGGWSYARKVLTFTKGWIPTEYVQAQ